ncbi:MAG TPA: CpsD/CapB family tyrosine-protein kinase [Terriglobales bacterium]|nr:CpsD/CapB family tyrosine-protein kinase [Terriglobales bacterium]
MSHIFDALQRAETERSGAELDDFALANELLKLAEAEATSIAERQAPPPPIQVPEARTAEPAHAAGTPERGMTESRLVESIIPPKINFEQFENLPIVMSANSKLVSITEKDSLAAEKFRFLAVRLRQLQQSRQLKKLLITSTIPEEGKTTVSANLACTFARRKQQRTLILEGDLRRPTLAKQFGLGRVPGLSEYLQGESDVIHSIYRLDALGLWILPAGRAPQNPLELMQAGKLSPLMDQLCNWFDWIVIDSPPVLPLADTSVWARVADGVLIVARPGKTEKHHLQRGVEALDRSKLLGALINSSANVARSNYYYRYGPKSQESTKETSETPVEVGNSARS